MAIICTTRCLFPCDLTIYSPMCASASHSSSLTISRYCIILIPQLCPQSFSFYRMTWAHLKYGAHLGPYNFLPPKHYISIQVLFSLGAHTTQQHTITGRLKLRSSKHLAYTAHNKPCWNWALLLLSYSNLGCRSFWGHSASLCKTANICILSPSVA